MLIWIYVPFMFQPCNFAPSFICFPFIQMIKLDKCITTRTKTCLWTPTMTRAQCLTWTMTMVCRSATREMSRPTCFSSSHHPWSKPCQCICITSYLRHRALVWYQSWIRRWAHTCCRLLRIMLPIRSSIRIRCSRDFLCVEGKRLFYNNTDTQS